MDNHLPTRYNLGVAVGGQGLFILTESPLTGCFALDESHSDGTDQAPKRRTTGSDIRGMHLVDRVTNTRQQRYPTASLVPLSERLPDYAFTE
jgi:hypothetical protein